MMNRAAMGGMLAVMVLFAGMATASAEPMDAGKAVTKLTRGFINLVTGWVEIPKRVQETTQTSGAAAGFTWGILRGIGYGFVRTAGGVYELCTFPFPAPPGYDPIIQPEYVFTADSTTPSYR